MSADAPAGAEGPVQPRPGRPPTGPPPAGPPPAGPPPAGQPRASQPPTGQPPAGQPRSPAGDADRDRLLGLLREHYALGNIDDAELDRRTGIVLSARYTDQAAAAVSDLPLLTGPGAGGGQGSAGQSSSGRVRGSRRRHAQADRPGAGWVPTSERFRDPASRMIMRVWIDPADDSRHYVPEAPSR